MGDSQAVTRVRKAGGGRGAGGRARAAGRGDRREPEEAAHRGGTARRGDRQPTALPLASRRRGYASRPASNRSFPSDQGRQDESSSPNRAGSDAPSSGS